MLPFAGWSRRRFVQVSVVRKFATFVRTRYNNQNGCSHECVSENPQEWLPLGFAPVRQVAGIKESEYET